MNPWIWTAVYWMDGLCSSPSVCLCLYASLHPHGHSVTGTHVHHPVFSTVASGLTKIPFVGTRD